LFEVKMKEGEEHVSSVSENTVAGVRPLLPNWQNKSSASCAEGSEIGAHF